MSYSIEQNAFTYNKSGCSSTRLLFTPRSETMITNLGIKDIINVLAHIAMERDSTKQTQNMHSFPTNQSSELFSQRGHHELPLDPLHDLRPDGLEARALDPIILSVTTGCRSKRDCGERAGQS